MKRIILFLLFSLNLEAANYSFPNDLPSLGCFFFFGTTYQCIAPLNFGSNDTIDVTSSIAIVNGSNFTANNGLTINTSGNVLTLTLGGFFNVKNNLNASTCINVEAGGDITIGNNGNIQGILQSNAGSVNLGNNTTNVPCAPPPSTTTPVAEYRMDECAWDGTTGEVLDSSANAYDGVSINAANTDAIARVCRSGKFDGIDDYIEQNDIYTTLKTTASLSFWIKTTQVGDRVFWKAPGIIGIEEAGGQDDIFWGWIDDNGHIGVQKSNNSGALSTTAINDDVWHHIILSRDAGSGESKVYVDGVLENVEPTGKNDVGNNFNRIGSIQDTGGTPTYFEGYLDELKTFDVILSDAQVLEIYTNELAGANYDGSTRTCNACNVFTPKDGNYTAVDLVNTGCSAATHWNDMLQTKIVNDNIALSILAMDKATNLPLEANITKVSLVHYPSGNNNACSGSVINSVEVCNNCGITDINGCLNLNVDKSLNQRASQCVEVLIEGKDKDDTQSISLSDSNASDNFAIRPNTYNCDGIVPSTLVSEHNYSSTFKAMPLNLSSASIGYTTTNVSLSAKKYMRTGDLNISLSGSLSSSGLSFVDGNTSTILSFNDVGDIGIDLNDSVWANVDSDDTAEINRVIHAECRRLFRADHFEVVLARPFLEDNASTNFTYLSNLSASLRMSAWMKGLNVSITAKGENNATMLNYKAPNTSFYANDVFLSPLVSLPDKHSPATKYPDLVDENGSDRVDFSFVNGVASYSYENLGFNYDRDYSSPIIPFRVDGNESLFSLSVRDNLYTSVIGSDSTDSDNNVSFYYGRLHPNDLITSLLPSNANLVYEVYDNTNSSYTAGMKQSSLFWYINNLHTNQNEGNITLATPSSDTLINNALGGFTFSYNLVSFGRENLGINTASTSRAFIHLNTQKWLWYVPSGFGSAYDDTSGSDCTMHPCFQFTLSANNTALKVQSGDFNGTVVPDVNRSDYIKTGVKLFR